MPRPRLSLATAAALILGIAAPQAHATVAKVAAIQAITQFRQANSTSWFSARVGTGLFTGDAFRTGKRSKGDLKFGDGSLIRLGQLSQLEVHGPKDTELTSGNLLFAMLKPGRILSGSAAAEIKGSVGIVSTLKDGRSRITLYSGIVDVVTALRTLRLKPGESVEVSKAGKIGPVTEAPPLSYAGGRLYPELTDPPNDSPYVGSDNHQHDRDDDDRKSVDTQDPRIPIVTVNPPGFPIDQPFPTPTGGTPPPFPTVPPPAAVSAAPLLRTAEVATEAAAPVSTSSIALLGAEPKPLEAATVAPDRHYVRAITVALQQEPDDFDLSLRAAENHIRETNLSLGHASGGDARLLAALADGGSYAYGARLHGYYAGGHWFLDAAFTPQRVAVQSSSGKVTQTITPVSDATVTYRDTWGDLQIGRQRFLGGPIQASLFGSLIRQSGREIMDGIRLMPKLGSAGKLDLAYLYDAYPRDLPYRVGGAQHGYYGRYSWQGPPGNFGLNVLKYTNVDNSTTGATVDFALPAIRNQLELYGEVGRDTFRRNLATGGLYFPGLYQKTDIDAYLEYAHVGDSSATDGPSDEVALRLYRRVNKNVDLTGTLSHFNGGDNTAILGLSIGTAVNRDE